MCGGSTELFSKNLSKTFRSGNVGNFLMKLHDPRGPFEGFASEEYEDQKEEDDKAALADAAAEEDSSKTEQYTFDNTGFGVGAPKKRTKKHGLRQNILTSGQGLV